MIKSVAPVNQISIVTISELSSYAQWCRNHLEWFGKVSNFKSFKYQVNFRLRELKELIKYVFVFIHVFLRIHAFVFNIIDRPGIYPLRWLSWCKRRQTQRHSETMKSFPISSMTLLSDQSKSVGVKFPNSFHLLQVLYNVDKSCSKYKDG